MKYEWRKNDKTIYKAAKQPELLTIPCRKFITIDGKGNPNLDDFAQRVSVLYSLAFQVKSQYKNKCKSEAQAHEQWEYDDFSVFPLEGIWTAAGTDPQDKDSFLYTIMIRQPDVITQEAYDLAYAAVLKKKPHPLLKETAFRTIEDGLCIQMLHEGSFDDEPASFKKMDRFAKEQGLERLSCYHREIYLSDSRKTAPEKRKTVLRYQISRQ